MNSRRSVKTWIVLASLAAGIALSCRTLPVDAAESVLALGDRRELFVDDFLIGELRHATFQMHQPEPGEVVLICDRPWEGNISAYYTIFQDDDRYRMYYRGAHWDEQAKKSTHPEFACYAESRDGVHWEKPELGLFEFQGSKANNIVWSGPGTHNFTVFKDLNPAAPPESRYKAVASGRSAKSGKYGLLAFHSPDAIHWSLMQEEPIITDGAFDSQNLVFWHPLEKKYFDFHRKGRDGIRDIMSANSTDFLNWTPPTFLDYGDAPREHLYTNAIQPYFRAPHLWLGFPTRFQPAHQQVEPILMTSRDGSRFRRWNEPLIPITAPQDRDGNRSNYMTWGLLQLPGKDRELSVYATEAYYAGPGSRVRRFTFRTDGFVSVHAGDPTGFLVTKPFTFRGSKLALNFKTARSGSLRVELQDANGKPLDGFALDDCQPLKGDEIEQSVNWTPGRDLSAHAGQPVRLRFSIANAHLFALRFAD